MPYSIGEVKSFQAGSNENTFVLEDFDNSIAAGSGILFAFQCYTGDAPTFLISRNGVPLTILEQNRFGPDNFVIALLPNAAAGTNPVQIIATTDGVTLQLMEGAGGIQFEVKTVTASPYADSLIAYNSDTGAGADNISSGVETPDAQPAGAFAFGFNQPGADITVNASFSDIGGFSNFGSGDQGKVAHKRITALTPIDASFTFLQHQWGWAAIVFLQELVVTVKAPQAPTVHAMVPRVCM